jgi:CxxC motif-containing protein (DUF1111 family)
VTRMAIRGIPLLALLVLGGPGGCDARGSMAGEWDDVAIGDPLPGLTASELERFQRGAALFRRIFTPEEGLGPLFNENACNACHTDPADGGTGDQFLIRATRYTPEEGCDLFLDQGGDNIRQQATPLLRTHGILRDEVPPEATATGSFGVPFLFGLGLVEAIPDETILAREGPDPDGRGLGISGRAARDARGRVARFGRKGQFTTLFDFSEDAIRLEMGLTTPLHPEEVGPNRGPVIPGTDPAENPEVDLETLEFLTDFVRFLAPPARELPSDPGERAIVESGEALFHEVGCTSCHVPSMTTGPSSVAALDRREIHLYSDLLLHDMGEALADVCGPSAGPSELRTEKLMGLGRRSRFLHDLRASSIREAVEFHGGEAATVRERFRALSFLDQERIIRFLYTL